MRLRNPYLKIAVLGAFGYYLYHLAKKNGGTLSGNDEGWKLKVDPGLAADGIAQVFGMNPMQARLLRVGSESMMKSLGRKFGIQRGNF